MVPCESYGSFRRRADAKRRLPDWPRPLIPIGRGFSSSTASSPFSRGQIRCYNPGSALLNQASCLLHARTRPMIPNRRAGFSLGRSRQPIADRHSRTAGGNEDIVAGFHLCLHRLAARLGRTAAHANIFAEFTRRDHDRRRALSGSASQLRS
jgi:hypothetical protein